MEHLRLTASEFYMILPPKTEKNVIAISNELRLTLNANLSWNTQDYEANLIQMQLITTDEVAGDQASWELPY